MFCQFQKVYKLLFFGTIREIFVRKVPKQKLDGTKSLVVPALNKREKREQADKSKTKYCSYLFDTV